MGWAERANPNSWINSDESTRREYARKSDAEDRRKFGEATSSGPRIFGAPAFMAHFLSLASSAIARRMARKKGVPG